MAWMIAGVKNNVTSESTLDLFERLAHKMWNMPDTMNDIAGKMFNGGSVIADATSQSTTADSTITNASSFAQSTASALEATFREAWVDGGEDGSSSIFMSIAQGIGKLKNFGGIFSYLTSRWALTTFTAVSG